MTATFNNILTPQDDNVHLTKNSNSSNSRNFLPISWLPFPRDDKFRIKFQLAVIILLSIVVLICLLLLVIPDKKAGNGASSLHTDFNTPGRCGGHIKVSGERELIYESHYENKTKGLDSICVWLISTENGGGIELNLINSSQINFSENDSRMVVSHTLSANNSFVNVIETVRTTQRFDQPFVLLWFYSKSLGSNHGFHLKLTERTMGVFPGVNFEFREYGEENARGVSYPELPLKHYPHNTRAFFWIKPTADKQIRLEMESVDTEPIRDGLQILKFLSSFQKVGFVAGSKLSGNLGKVSGLFYTGKNEPLIIYFHSDQDGVGEGFKFNYNYL